MTRNLYIGIYLLQNTNYTTVQTTNDNKYI